MMRSRTLRRASLVATILAGIWTAVLVFVGGFDLPVGGVVLSSHEPLRPILWGSLTLAIFVWTNGVEPTAASWTRFLNRLNHHFVAAALALSTIVGGVMYSGTAASASDAYGYISQVDLWLRGDLKIAQPWVADVPWPEPQWTFTPLGYRPSPVENDWSLVPVYSPGMPLLMAGARLIGGHGAMFLLVPMFGAILALATYGIGRRFGMSAAGLMAMWFVIASPTYLFMLALPMIDIPVAALWALAFYLLLGRGIGFALAAGLLTAIAILVRPNLVPLAGVFGVWLVLNLWWRRTDPLRTTMARLLVFSASVAPACVAIGLLFKYLYGSPFHSGYGGLDVLFGWANVLPNLLKYFGWLIETQTVLGLAGLAAVFVPLSSVWPGVRDRRLLVIVALFVAVLWAEYCIYLGFDTWWFLRFLLPSWPFIMLGLAGVLLAVARARGALGTVVVTWLVVVLGVYTFDVGQARGAFTLWRTERAYVAAAQLTRSLTPDNSVVFTLLHSGSTRYYGGRMTMRFDLLDKEWLDRVVAWLAERGVQSYALLDGSEIDDFKTRFASQQAIARLKDPPLFTLKGPPALQLIALSGPAPAETLTPAIDWKSLRSTPPVDPPRLVFR
jgi:hypothetical protein